MKPPRTLAELYQRIPSMACKPGCTDCCGPVPAVGVEAVAAPLLAEHKVAERMASGCIDCPYSAGADCAIHPQRPFLCRLFGTAPGHALLTCPHGCQPDHPLTPAQADELARHYFRLVR